MPQLPKIRTLHQTFAQNNPNMDTRRDFLKKAALLAGSAPLWELLPESIRAALAIDPEMGTTYLDAEHVVILMQENRSFDHIFGALQGVRGFEDPRAIRLPNGRPVWLQSNTKNETFAPFRLNIKESKATWLGSLPHSWTDQTDARNGGKHDGWLEAKRSGHEACTEIPLTLGYYTREDLPFYYALADAFTVCDQHFCSSLTGTTPNRLYLWTGTIRQATNDPNTKANVRNSDVDYDKWVNWKTFPERLEAQGISWKIYQNETSLPMGFSGEQDAWLASFTDNPLEWFEQYHVRFSPAFYKYLQSQMKGLPISIDFLEAKAKSLPQITLELEETLKQLEEARGQLAKVQEALRLYTPENFARLTEFEQNIHKKAFTTNINDPDYHDLNTLHYQDGLEQRTVSVPKGDTLHQFRADVQAKKLPTVSWLVAPENFSDHPGAPWYGAWYVSEVMDILTADPETWKKTIFILTYDENDGYFDHQPPFVPPHLDQPNSGKVSEGLDTRAEFVSLDQERKDKRSERDAREGPIGLGFRVPMVIASPWSRGGRVCSEVFDHTSPLQFLEHFLSHKTGKALQETNIHPWRRAICGDLRSAFRPYHGEKYALPPFLNKDAVIRGIHQAQFKSVPTGYNQLTNKDIEQIQQSPKASSYMPRQEKGMRPSCALPYELYADGGLSADRKSIILQFSVGQAVFKERTAGAPFLAYAQHANRAYAVIPGSTVEDNWALSDWQKETYLLELYGPNGFYRKFQGNAADPALEVRCGYQKGRRKGLSGRLEIRLNNSGATPILIEFKHYAYGYESMHYTLPAGANTTLWFDLKKSHHWYDIGLRVQGFPNFEKRYAGRIETGEEGWTDPMIGAVE